MRPCGVLVSLHELTGCLNRVRDSVFRAHVWLEIAVGLVTIGESLGRRVIEQALVTGAVGDVAQVHHAAALVALLDVAVGPLTGTDAFHEVGLVPLVRVVEEPTGPAI